MLDGTCELRPVACDSYTLYGIAGDDGECTFARQFVGISGIINASQLPSGRLSLGYDKGVRGGLHIVIEGACLYLDALYRCVILNGYIATRHHQALQRSRLHQIKASVAFLGQQGTGEGCVHLEISSGRDNSPFFAHHLHG